MFNAEYLLSTKACHWSAKASVRIANLVKHSNYSVLFSYASARSAMALSKYLKLFRNEAATNAGNSLILITI